MVKNQNTGRQREGNIPKGSSSRGWSWVGTRAIGLSHGAGGRGDRWGGAELLPGSEVSEREGQGRGWTMGREGGCSRAPPGEKVQGPRRGEAEVCGWAGSRELSSGQHVLGRGCRGSVRTDHGDNGHITRARGWPEAGPCLRGGPTQGSGTPITMRQRVTLGPKRTKWLTCGNEVTLRGCDEWEALPSLGNPHSLLVHGAQPAGGPAESLTSSSSKALERQPEDRFPGEEPRLHLHPVSSTCRLCDARRGRTGGVMT